MICTVCGERQETTREGEICAGSLPPLKYSGGYWGSQAQASCCVTRTGNTYCDAVELVVSFYDFRYFIYGLRSLLRGRASERFR